MKKMWMNRLVPVGCANVFLILLLCWPCGTTLAQSAGQPTIGEVFRAVSPAIVKVWVHFI